DPDQKTYKHKPTTFPALGQLKSLALDPLGKPLAVASGSGALHLFDLTQPEPPALILRKGNTGAVAFGTEGKGERTLLSAGDGGEILVWQQADGQWQMKPPLKTPYGGFA